MSRRTLLVVLAGLAVVLASVWLLWPRTERITQENYLRQLRRQP